MAAAFTVALEFAGAVQTEREPMPQVCVHED